MTTIHIVTGGKGNVGKSAFASLLTCAALNAKAQPLLVDADDQKQTFSLLHGKQVKQIAFLDDPMFEDQPDIIWHLAQQKRDVIVDLAAQSDVYLNRWMKSRRLIRNASREGIKIIKWWVADLDQDAFDKLVSQCKKHQNDDITYVLVKSYYRSRAAIWDDVLASNQALKTAIQHKLKTIELPRMFEGLMDKLRQQQLTIHSVLLDEDHQNIDMLDRAAVQNWVEDGIEQIETIYQFTADSDGHIVTSEESNEDRKACGVTTLSASEGSNEEQTEPGTQEASNTAQVL